MNFHEFVASAWLKVHTSDQRRVDLDQACFVVEARSADAVGRCKCQDKAVSNEPPHLVLNGPDAPEILTSALSPKSGLKSDIGPCPKRAAITGLHHLVGVELLANFNDRSKRALTQLLRKRQSLEAASGDWLTMKSHI